MPLTTEEKIFLIKFVFREGDKYTVRVQKRSKEQFSLTKVPHRDTVCNLIEKFRRTGSVKDEGRIYCGETYERIVYTTELSHFTIQKDWSQYVF